MQQIFDMLAKGNFRGIALLIIVGYSGIYKRMREGSEMWLMHMGPESFRAEFVVGVIWITMSFMVGIVLSVTILVIILQDAGIDVIPNRFKRKK